MTEGTSASTTSFLYKTMIRPRFSGSMQGCIFAETRTKEPTYQTGFGNNPLHFLVCDPLLIMHRTHFSKFYFRQNPFPIFCGFIGWVAIIIRVCLPPPWHREGTSYPHAHWLLFLWHFYSRPLTSVLEIGFSNQNAATTHRNNLVVVVVKCNEMKWIGVLECPQAVCSC